MQKKYDVIIIGAGIIGASIAFELSKSGYRTLNVDKLAAAGLGSTANTCAIIRTTYSTLGGVAIARDSYFSWKHWRDYLEVDDERGLAVFKEIGSVVIKPPNFDMDKYFKTHDELNIPYEVWDRKKLLQRFPHFTDNSFHPPKRYDDPKFGEASGRKINNTVVYFPHAGYINDAVLSVHNVQSAAEAKGGEFVFGRAVTAINRSQGRVTGVKLSDGETIEAPIVVNAAGPHSFVINRMAGIEGSMKIKTQALRHEVHFVPSPPDYSYEENEIQISDGDIGGYHRPETGNLILVGSEDPECDGREWVSDPDDFNRETTNDQYKAQVYRFAQRVPSIEIPNKPQGIVDLYDVSDDWIPIYDRSDLKGFYLAIGTSGNQYKNGPTVGLMMMEIIKACEQGHDHDQEPVQVKLRNIDFTLDTKTFSRNREINQSSSFSVLG